MAGWVVLSKIPVLSHRILDNIPGLHLPSWININANMDIVITRSVKCEMKILIHFQTSTVSTVGSQEVDK